MIYFIYTISIVLVLYLSCHVWNSIDEELIERVHSHKLDSQSKVFKELEIWFLIAIMFLFAIIYTDNFVIKIFNFLLILIYIFEYNEWK